MTYKCRCSQEDRIFARYGRSFLKQDTISQYPFVSATDSLPVFLTMRQTFREDLFVYVKKFKQQWEIVKSQVCKKILTYFMVNTEEYVNEKDSNRKDAVLNNCFEQ